ncbi:putative membrane protein [Streptomyces avermitilis MA-4680 = NBRC 14893]|uniref:Membrane protein n=1 Tax=Streptomyces avermitilis (strain ATCC 31267 / DSM 46492 / JCM 5070 / NBRC 14893 / NCIMB 12804 / NRRL 8165 / MA-4680) TaxID=227882 RepID=Q829G2_STRAW|nr:putative membrane protein [Streptomyces avermitilis MA-4680 = NBRC 14893]
MSLIRPPAGPNGGDAAPSPVPAAAPARRLSPGRAVAVLALVAVAALIPLLGPAAALHGTGEAAAPGAGGIALLRTVLFAAVCMPAGEWFAGRLARRVPGAPLADASDAPRGWAPGSRPAPVSVAAPGAPPRSWPPGNSYRIRLAEIDVGGLYRTRDGALALLEVNAFAVAGLCALSRRPAGRVWPSAAVVVAEALRVHPTTEHSPSVGSGLTLVHLTCAVLWAGGLPHVLRTVRRWRAPGPGAALLGLYARVAAVLLAAITATGVWSSLRRMPAGTIPHQLTATAYGRTLVAKVFLVAAVAVLALWARRRLRRADDPLGACVPARAEVVALGVVVAVSALLTALPLPIRW